MPAIDFLFPWTRTRHLNLFVQTKEGRARRPTNCKAHIPFSFPPVTPIEFHPPPFHSFPSLGAGSSTGPTFAGPTSPHNTDHANSKAGPTLAGPSSPPQHGKTTSQTEASPSTVQTASSSIIARTKPRVSAVDVVKTASSKTFESAPFENEAAVKPFHYQTSNLRHTALWNPLQGMIAKPSNLSRTKMYHLQGNPLLHNCLREKCSAASLGMSKLERHSLWPLGLTVMSILLKDQMFYTTLRPSHTWEG